MARAGRWPRLVQAHPRPWGAVLAGLCLVALLVLAGILPLWTLLPTLAAAFAAAFLLTRSASPAAAAGASTEHRLAALWFADVVDYSRLAASDERAALRLVRVFQTAARESVQAHGGRIVKFMGDGALAEFLSTEAAVRSAFELREAFASSTAGGPPGTHDVRVGVHVGDLTLLPDGDVYGDGVNVAARLQGVADPGQVVVSEDVWRQLRQRTELRFEPLGERALKGSREPFDVYRVQVVAPTGEGALERPVVGAGGAPRSRAMLAGVVAGSLALAAVGLWALLRNGGQALVPGEAYADAAAPGVAVLPFHVTGADPDEWREPMVDLLSKNLDDVSGLRAIDPRTVLARWRESGTADGGSAPAGGLAVARRTGARYTVMGEAVALAGGVRLSADLYDVASGQRIGQARVEGREEELLPMIDRLTIQLVRHLLAEDAPRGISLASVTTDSLAALKAYLEGEQQFRRSNYAAAIEAYERAVEIDSTFATALHRLSLATGYSDRDLSREYAERAVRFSARLTRSDRAVLIGTLALERGTLDGLATLREAVERHPDDLEAWYQLGETYYHMAGQTLSDPARADRAFERVVAIDSTFSVVYAHLIENAFGYHGDASRATRFIDIFARFSDNRVDLELYRLGWSLGFGDPGARSRAFVAVESRSLEDRRFIATNLLWGAPHRVVQARVLPDRSTEERYALFLLYNRVARGRLDGALEALDGTGLPGPYRAVWTHALAAWGWPVPEERLASLAGGGMSDDPPTAFVAGALAIDRGNVRAHAAILRRFEREADSLLAAGDSLSARLTLGLADGLRGYAAWRRGEPRAAVAPLERAQRTMTGFWDVREDLNATLRLWLGQLHRELGNDDAAARYFRSFWGLQVPLESLGNYELGRTLDEAGDEAGARKAYARFLAAWAEPDPRLAPWVERAKNILAGT